MIAKRNEFVKKTAGHRAERLGSEERPGEGEGRGYSTRKARGYGNPYFKKGLEKLWYRGEGRETERILISLENEEKTF